MTFLVAGLSDDVQAHAQAGTLLEATLGRHPQRTHLWWARQGGRCVAAAMVFDNVGKTAMLFANPVSAPGVDAAALVQLVAGIGQHAVGRGITVVQAMLPPSQVDDIRALHLAGFKDLAQLVYMRRSIEKAPQVRERQELEWLHHGQFDGQRLGRVIESAYGQSLDCPQLEGVREVSDVIAGHKACGRFCPNCWWIVVRSGQDAGCILVNDHDHNSDADVIYMGVAPEHRGAGLGRAMIGRAICQAHQRGRSGITLAVDDLNTYAKTIYESFGFVEVQRRLAMAMLAKPNLPTANRQRL